ncbi:MAG: shikimate dehydrogenase [Alphaproteobacteria bacterium]
MNLCVIGKPLKHSFSPIIHNYWLRKYSKPYIYEKKEIESSFLPDIISQMKNKKLIGVNVTIPYKRSVYNLLKNLDINAKKSKAVNTIYLKNEKVFGQNTDGVGYCQALKQEMNFNVMNKNILVLGSGGASFGIVSELINRGVSKIIVSNRTLEKSYELIKNFKNKITKFEVMKWEELKPCSNTDLIINTTSFGMKKNQEIQVNIQNLKNSTIYSDIIYNPKKTLTMKTFEDKGFLTQNGLGMLVNQAAEAFRLWFNINLTKQDINEAKDLCEETY